VDAVEFTDEGIRVHFDATSYAKAKDSCIVWQGEQGPGRDWDFYYWVWPINEGWSAKPISEDLATEVFTNDVGVPFDHSWGSLLYPTTILPASSDAVGPDSNYFFHYGCNASQTPIRIFNLTDFSSGQVSESGASTLATEAPAQGTALEFVYPQDGQVLDYEGSYIFEVTPRADAEGYLWGFFQNGVMVWENMANEGVLSGTTYAIEEGTFAHTQFSPGYTEVWVRPMLGGGIPTDAIVIGIYLEPR
jgi:hypothetical protein